MHIPKIIHQSKWLALFFTLVLLSQACQRGQLKKEQSLNSSEVQNYLNREAVKILADSLALAESEISDLLYENDEMVEENRLYYRKIHIQQSTIDSLNSHINALESEMDKLSLEKHSVDNKDAESIQNMVRSMHVSWKELPQNKDPQQILKYFLPNFMTSQINIDTENEGHVSGYTHEDYIQYLNEIVSRKRFSVEFGDVTFLDIEVKDREFFNVAYKCALRSYKKDVLSKTSSVLVTITGRRMEGAWKIANYSVVAFSY